MNAITLLINRQPVDVFCSVTILLSFAIYRLPLPRRALPFLLVLNPHGDPSSLLSFPVSSSRSTCLK